MVDGRYCLPVNKCPGSIVSHDDAKIFKNGYFSCLHIPPGGIFLERKDNVGIESVGAILSCYGMLSTVNGKREQYERKHKT